MRMRVATSGRLQTAASLRGCRATKAEPGRSSGVANKNPEL